MKRPKSPRIPTDTPSTPLATPFAALEFKTPPPHAAKPDPPNTSANSTASNTPLEGKKGTVLLRRETAHRHGGTVIAVMDFSPPHNEKQLQLLAADLKKYCATGGTVKNGRIEIQGEMLAPIKSRLQALGYNPRGC